MYIKSMVIDGFKSYAQRTEITGFDNLFNAVTGLNGSGKSNILDAICFLLGISNMSQVRASNLQELVYKSGQAGVSKATVSITFDNHDKKNSPLGYEQYDEFTVSRQIVIGGRNKYTINGTNANNTRVQDLFRSVQLNVNNPHFLIMQGRITKVLNMKPMEILSMIEEAAGTKLYESKKEVALKTIEKKNAKLAEIDTILKEEISPKLNKLKDERASYLNYQKVIRELEHLTKLYIAYRFICAEETRKKCSNETSELQETIQIAKQRIDETNEKIDELDKMIDELEKKRDQESGNIMEKLDENLKQREKDDAKCQSVIDNKKQAIKAEQKNQKEVNKNISDDNKALTSKEKEKGQLDEEWSRIQEACKNDQAAHTEAQKQYQAVSSGLSANTDGEHATLNDQLMAAKNEISKAETEVKQCQMRLKHGQEEVKKREAEVKKTAQQYTKDKAAFDSLQAGMNKIETEMKKLNYEDGKEEKLMDERRAMSKEMQQLRTNLDALEGRFPQLRFQYSDPEPNFDRRKVHGLVAKLIEVNRPEAATALQVAARAKLYNIVVDTEMTGKKLLQKGNLQQRYTIIPLNKISGRSIDDATLKKAEALVGKGNVFTALSLVNYDKKLHAAMEFVFGQTLVCRDMNIAKTLAYTEGIMKRCVTLDGDDFDPSGTLTGGSRPQTNSILLKVKEFREIETQLHAKEDQVSKIDREISAIKSVADKYKDMKHQFELKEHECSLMKANLEQGSHHQQMEEINRLKADIVEQTEVVKTAEETQKRCRTKVKDLEDKIKNAGAIREKELKEAESRVKTCKKKVEESEKNMKNKQQVMDSLKLECEELGKAITGYEEQLKVIGETLAKYEEQMVELTDAVNQTSAKVAEAKAELDKQKDLLKSRNRDIGAKVDEKKQLQSDVKACKLDIQKTEHDISKHQKELKDAGRQVDELIKKYDWIPDEKKYFGQANTAYDFETNDPKEAGKRIQQLQDNKDKLEKSVNMRAMNMLGNAEEQFNDLIKKRTIVQNDKAKIAAVILELDEKKNEALKKAWVQVNKDFGSIFTTLLPGTQAKLDPPEGQSVLMGLEVKVAFGDVWKESLSELSGGQRSLVALSLILAMLLFKPAPIYILDEVDAALDLSHTQNIGQMIKSHFKHSQFIVVSLKDGMFNNANVLYKTKFVDGVSTVTRHVQQHNKSSNVASAGKENRAAAQSKSSKDKQNKNKRTRLEEDNVM